MCAIRGFFNEYRWLSNFWPCPVEFEGDMYKSSEAAYQAAKCAYRGDRALFFDLDASASKRKGRQVPIRTDWNQIKLIVMKTILIDKFGRNEDLKQKLLATKDAYLEETNYWKDTFWGVYEGRGENHLGMTLMEVRKLFQNQQS